MQRVTGSKFKLAQLCSYAWVSDLPWVEGKSWSATIGTHTHTYAETGRLPASKDILELTDRQVEIIKGGAAQYKLWAAARPSEMVGVRKEVALWYHPDTGNCGEVSQTGPVRKHRDYSSAPAGAWCATIDMVGGPDTSWDFADIKTGWAPDPPDKSEQMLFIGIIIASMRGKPEVRSGILSLREKNHAFMPATLNEFALDATRRKVSLVQKAIVAGDGPKPGAHCKLCPIQQSCPSSTVKKKKRKNADHD